MSNIADRFSPWEHQVIALAGIAQSAQLVRDLATSGVLQQDAAIATINSLLTLNPASIADIYPNVSHLSLGLRSLQAIFSNERLQQHVDVIRYTLGILVLRNKLMSNARMQDQLRSGLRLIDPIGLPALVYQDESAKESEQLRTERTFEQLARLYQDTISTLSYRIQVQGNIEHLKNDQNAIRIRALLLAGIRSAVLWHQLGGRRWKLVFYRKRIHNTAATIRRKLIVSV